LIGNRYDGGMNKKQIAEKILMTLEGQRFADWYNSGDFEKYITGDLNEKGIRLAKEKILEQIILLFHLWLTSDFTSVIVVTNMNINWTFDDGVKKTSCSTFPFAFRMMHNILRKASEAGQPITDMTRFKILAPVGKEYSYARACELATQQGLLAADGSLNSREFKRR
jgi:hypothetical protein